MIVSISPHVITCSWSCLLLSLISGRKAGKSQKRKLSLNLDGAQKILQVACKAVLISGPDPQAREKLPRGVPRTLHGWPSSKPGSCFTLTLCDSIFAKVLQISPLGNVVNVFLGPCFDCLLIVFLVQIHYKVS